MKITPLLFTLLLPVTCLATDAELLLSEQESGQPIKRVHPKYPLSEARMGKEGWVRLDFVVDEQGQVVDAVVLDSSGVKGFERAAARAVRQWQYEPAKVEGKPVQQCYKVQLNFAMQDPEVAVTRQFAKGIREIQSQLKNKQLDEARNQLAQLREQPKWNLTEDAWYWLVDALYQEHEGNTQKQIASLWRVAKSAGQRLPTEQMHYVLHQLFVLQTQQNQFAAALKSHERLKEIPGSADLLDDLQPFVDKIHQVINSEQPLFVPARVNERRHWEHQLSRSGFSLAQIEGELDTLEVRCERQLQVYKAVSDSVWMIPPAWGQCRVLVNGEPGSEFKLVELQPVPETKQTATL